MGKNTSPRFRKWGLIVYKLIKPLSRQGELIGQLSVPLDSHNA